MLRATFTPPLQLVVGIIAAAACRAPATSIAPAAGAPSARVDESLPPAHVHFDVTTPLAGVTRIAGLLWIPPRGARTVIVCVHGSGGSKENWGPISAPGYSFAHAMIAGGRAVLAIDLPGYGESKPASDQQSAEDFALAVDQVARAVRAGRYVDDRETPPGFDKVVGHGLSIGALVVEIAQGAHASFDGIIAAGWSQGGFSEPYKACLYRDICPDDPLSQVWYVLNVDPAVLAFVRATRPNQLAPSGRTSVHLWGGLVFQPAAHGGTGEGVAVPSDAPDLDALTRTIRVPVLLLFGSNDFTWDMTRVADERRHFPASSSVEETILPETGHFVRWHRTNARADAVVAAWLAARGF